MTQEEKQLLLKDLCGRFPYGVALCAFYKTDEGWKEGNTCLLGMCVDEGYIKLHLDNGWITYLDDVNPYLRPMSSMTDEEFTRYDETLDWRYVDDDHYESLDTLETFDWLNEHHFDYRGLIEKGLALVAPEGMYKTE